MNESSARSETATRFMLLPRFSIQLILILTAACAVVFLIATYAARGHNWAVGIVTSVVAVLFLLVAYGLVFAVTFFVTKVFRSLTAPKPSSPFATDALPPQVIPPRDPD